MRDARLLDHYPPGSRRVEARSPWVWIHHKGGWRKGAVHCWYVHGDTWMAWMQHEDPAPEVPWSTWGLYIFDGTTIRRRHSPAARARIEGGRHLAGTLRETGYSVEPCDHTLLLG